jgi:hypothetical protein
MHQRLHLRLKALEKWLPDETKPRKALLPEWLMEDLRQQGVRFDASGLPEKSSLEEKALERIAGNACAKPGPTAQLLWQSVMNAPSHAHRTKFEMNGLPPVHECRIYESEFRRWKGPCP